MKSLEQIIEPYKHLLDEVDYKNVNNGRLNPDVYMFTHWAYKIPQGWYGFSLGNEVPMAWAYTIDKFLEEVNKECPNFEIHQIKLKWGGLRCYLGNINESVQKEVDKLEELLYDDSLVY